MSVLNQYFTHNPNMNSANLSSTLLLYRYRLTQSLMYTAGSSPPRSTSCTSHVHGRGSDPQLAPDGLRAEGRGVRVCPDSRRAREPQVVSAIFDGLTRVDEAVAMVLHVCTADFKLKQLLVSLVTVAKHMDGQEMSTLFL